MRRRRHPLLTLRLWLMVLVPLGAGLFHYRDRLPLDRLPLTIHWTGEEPQASVNGIPAPPAESDDATTPVPFAHDDLPSLPVEPNLLANVLDPSIADAQPLRAPLPPGVTATNVLSAAPPFPSDSPALATPTPVRTIVAVNDTQTAMTIPNQPTVQAIDLSQIDALIQNGEDIAAHKLLSEIYWKQPESRSQVIARLKQLARRIYFQPQPHFMDPAIIEPGDRLQRIADGYNVSWEYLAKLNHIDPKRIRAGQKLKVIRGPFSAVVDLSEFQLTVHAHGYFVRRYTVGLGKDGSTPLGRFTVQEKLSDPTYYGPNGVIDSDDPANPLGERWIDLGDSYGIHGTIDPESIGKCESRGCVRMLADDVAEVYDLLTVGSEVAIKR